jgi:3-dehydroquinate synthase
VYVLASHFQFKAENQHTLLTMDAFIKLFSSAFSNEVSGEVLETGKAGATLSKEIVEAWASLPTAVRAALVSSELSSGRSSITTQETSVSSMTSSNNSDASGEKEENASEMEEECPVSGAKMILKPLERAPENVFEFTKTTTREKVEVQKTPSALVTTKTTVVTSSRGWRNVFTLPISYDINVVPHGTLLDATNPQLLETTGVHPEGYNRRFAVIDAAVDEIYGDKIRSYFAQQGIDLHTCILNGGESDKRPDVSVLIV